MDVQARERAAASLRLAVRLVALCAFASVSLAEPALARGTRSGPAAHEVRHGKKRG